jgi:hypothetical protein
MNTSTERHSQAIQRRLVTALMTDAIKLGFCVTILDPTTGETLIRDCVVVNSAVGWCMAIKRTTVHFYNHPDIVIRGGRGYAGAVELAHTDEGWNVVREVAVTHHYAMTKILQRVRSMSQVLQGAAAKNTKVKSIAID